MLFVMDRNFLISHTASPYFAVNLLAGIVILFYLLNTETIRLFEERS